MKNKTPITYNSCGIAFIAGIFTVLAAAAQGAVLAYSFTGNSLEPTEDSVSAYAGEPMTFHSALFGTTGFLTSTPSDGIYGYGGSGGAHWAANGMNQSTAVDATAPYLQFTMTPEAGMFVEVQRIVFGARSLGTTNTGQKGTWPGPVRYEIRSSVDDYASSVDQGVFPNQAGGNTMWYLYDHTFDTITEAIDTPLAFRIYLLDAGSGTRDGAFRIDDVTFSPIPEASNVALIVSAVALMLVLVKRKRLN